jgi:hypothetical protein
MMKKITAVFAALLGILSVTAFCAARDVTMEELYQANQSADLAENYESMRYTADTYDSAGELIQSISGQYFYGSDGWKYEETSDYIVSKATACGIGDNGSAAFYYTYRRNEWKEGDVTKTVTILPNADFEEFMSGYSSMLTGCYGIDILNVKEDGDALVIETEAYYPGEDGEKLSPWSIVYTADAETLALRSIEENNEDGSKAVTTFVYNDPQEFTCEAKTVCETAAEGTTDLTVTILEKDQEPSVQHYVVGNDTGVFFNSVYGGAFYNDENGTEPIETLTLTGDPLEIYALAGIESGE